MTGLSWRHHGGPTFYVMSLSAAFIIGRRILRAVLCVLLSSKLFRTGLRTAGALLKVAPPGRGTLRSSVRRGLIASMNNNNQSYTNQSRNRYRKPRSSWYCASRDRLPEYIPNKKSRIFHQLVRQEGAFVAAAVEYRRKLSCQ